MATLKNCYLTVLILFASLFALQAQNVGIIPAPQQIELRAGSFVWEAPVLKQNPQLSSFNFLKEQLSQLPDYAWIMEDTPSETILVSPQSIRLELVKRLPVPKNENQAYRIVVSSDEIVVSATTEQGLFYGVQSLKQLFRYNYRLYFAENEHVTIPCMEIVDYPELEYRGWMDDISRGPISTVDFLKRQIRILSEFKLNCFSLYTENTFKSSSYNYAPADALTPAEIRELETYARQYYVELIGNQQCFAHFEKILSQPEFAYLADSKANLNPASKETYKFLNKVLNEELACYSSPYFNINCDETEQLGTGAAADYVKQVGAEEAYAQHVIKVHDILKKKGKKTMMWADIVLKSNKIINRLPKDITMMVWSYVPSDSFTQMIRPVKDAGFDFWVVPGVSMWSTIFPDMPSYEKNIANFARDGAKLGARGLLNTAWNDSGEAMLNSAWHAFGWGAEMSWKPITSDESEAAESERSSRLAVFDTNFNFQFFHFYNNENIIADFLRVLPTYKESPVPEIYNTGSLWSYCPWQFFPPHLTNEAHNDLKQERFRVTATMELEKLILSEVDQYENPEIIYCALQAAHRLINEIQLRIFRITSYDLLCQSSTTDEDVFQVNESIADFEFWIKKLQIAYDYLWNMEYRPYWQSVNDAKYDALIRSVKEFPQYVFYETKCENGVIPLKMRTMFNDVPIHYTLDGSEPTEESPVYRTPIGLDHSCTVRTLTVTDSVGKVYGEKSVNLHLGMLARAECSGGYSTYRAEYSGGGESALFDGEVGSDSYRDGHWQGYQGKDVAVAYSWPAKQHVGSVQVSYLQNYYDWILAPTDVEIYTREGDSDWKLVLSRHFDVNQVVGNQRGKLQISDLNINTGFLKIVVKNPGVLPPEHGGAGEPSFIFLDEIFINR